MRSFVLIVGGALLLSAGAATAQSAPAAQSMPPAHAQHHGTGKHSASRHGQRCCCEKEMHQMMAMMHEMMAMHKGGMHHNMKMPTHGEPSN